MHDCVRSWLTSRDPMVHDRNTHHPPLQLLAPVQVGCRSEIGPQNAFFHRRVSGVGGLPLPNATASSVAVAPPLLLLPPPPPFLPRAQTRLGPLPAQGQRRPALTHTTRRRFAGAVAMATVLCQALVDGEILTRVLLPADTAQNQSACVRHSKTDPNGRVRQFQDCRLHHTHYVALRGCDK